MDSIIITPSNQQDLKLLTSIAKRMGLEVKVFTEERQEELGMAYLINQADRSKIVVGKALIKRYFHQDNALNTSSRVDCCPVLPWSITFNSKASS